MMFMLFILLIFVGMFFKKSKWFDFFIIAFIATISYLGKDVADFENYETAYNYISMGNYYKDLGVGWYYLCTIGAKLGLGYLQFKTLIIIVSMLLVNSTIKYFTKDCKYKSFIWSLYLIFPVLLDCVQIRFFLAEAIVLYALRFLFDSNKRGIIKYIILVLLAATVHSSVLLYLIFLLYKILGKYESKYIIIMILLTAILSIFKNEIINLLSLVINQERIQRYFYSNDTLGIKGIISYTFIIFLFYYITNVIIKKCRENRLEEEKIHFFSFISKLNILISITIALSVFDPNFFRLQRIMWIIMYISIIRLLNYDIKNITIFNISMPVSIIAIFFAIIGNLIFISLNNFNVVQSLLL